MYNNKRIYLDEDILTLGKFVISNHFLLTKGRQNTII